MSTMTMTMPRNQVTISRIMDVLGISPTACELISQMEFLLQTDEERSRFLCAAMGKDGQEINKLLMNIRREKIKLNRMSLREFITHYKYNELEAIEQLLQEYINPLKYEKFKESGITPERVFKIHMMNPFAHIMKIILFA